MAEVFHRVYTHAVLDSFDSTGGRAVPAGERDVAVVLPELAGDIDELLRKTTPEAHGTAWIVRRFISSGWAYGCVITSYPDLIVDARGRSGVLNHARLVRVGAGEATFDIAQLVATAAEFPIEDVCQSPAERRLADYLDAVSGEQAVEVRPVSIEVLDQLPREFLREFLIACLAGLGARKSMRYVVPSDEGGSIESLATAWAALPLGLQPASSFGFGVADGCPVDAIFSGSGSSTGVASEGLAGCVTRYLNLLLDTSYDSQSLLRNREITSVSKLEQMVSNAEAPGKKAMKKTKKRDDWTPPQNEAAPQVDRQYKAMEESLRAYIDQRLSLLESRPPSAGGVTAQSAGGLVPAGSGNWLAWTIALTAAAVAIFAVVMMLLRSPDRPRDDDGSSSARIEEQTASSDLTETEASSSGSANRRVLEDAIARANASGKWADELKNLLTDHPTLSAGAVRAAANGDMSDRSRTALEKLAQQIEGGTDLGRDRREALRALLLEAIAASVSSNVTVDGTLTDLKPELLERIKEKFRVAAAAKAASPEFQAEVILRWMKDREP